MYMYDWYIVTPSVLHRLNQLVFDADPATVILPPSSLELHSLCLHPLVYLTHETPFRQGIQVFIRRP